MKKLIGLGALLLGLTIAGWKYKEYKEYQASQTPEAKSDKRMDYAASSLIPGSDNADVHALASGDFKRECLALGGTPTRPRTCDVPRDWLYEHRQVLVGQDTVDSELESKVYVAHEMWLKDLRANAQREQRQLDYINDVANGRDAGPMP